MVYIETIISMNIWKESVYVWERVWLTNGEWFFTRGTCNEKLHVKFHPETIFFLKILCTGHHSMCLVLLVYKD